MDPLIFLEQVLQNSGFGFVAVTAHLEGAILGPTLFQEGRDMEEEQVFVPDHSDNHHWKEMCLKG